MVKKKIIIIPRERIIFEFEPQEVVDYLFAGEKKKKGRKQK